MKREETKTYEISNLDRYVQARRKSHDPAKRKKKIERKRDRDVIQRVVPLPPPLLLEKIYVFTH